MKLNTITLIGVGLIGGSLVLDLKRQKYVQTVVGIDLDAANLARAKERSVIDEAYSKICRQAIENTDLLLIATPVAALANICRAVAPFLSEQTMVSDVGSTKQSVLAAFRTHLPEHFARCVAAHPIAGAEQSGALAARFGLYQDKKLIICPHENQDLDSLKTISEMWQAVGANVYTMSAQAHDEIFAAVSHFPHLLAFSYMHQMLDDKDGAEKLAFAGSGFRDFTRIAASSPEMWRDILLANKNSILDLIKAQKIQLDFLERCLKENRAMDLHEYFQAAKNLRQTWGDNH